MYDRPDLSATCLQRIAENTPEPHEVIVVDNGSQPHSVDVTVRNPTNRGFAVACNQGARRANGDVLVFLNNDTEVQAGWLPPLLHALQFHDIVQPLLTYPDGSVQCSGVRVEFSLPPGEEAKNLHDLPLYVTEVDAVTGACLAIKAETFDRFDEGYLNGYEDVDLCLRHGRCAVVPQSVVVHLESQSDQGARFGHAAENIARLRAQHGGAR